MTADDDTVDQETDDDDGVADVLEDVPVPLVLAVIDAEAQSERRTGVATVRPDSDEEQHEVITALIEEGYLAPASEVNDPFTRLKDSENAVFSYDSSAVDGLVLTDDGRAAVLEALTGVANWDAVSEIPVTASGGVDETGATESDED